MNDSLNEKISISEQKSLIRNQLFEIENQSRNRRPIIPEEYLAKTNEILEICGYVEANMIDGKKMYIHPDFIEKYLDLMNQYKQLEQEEKIQERKNQIIAYPMRRTYESDEDYVDRLRQWWEDKARKEREEKERDEKLEGGFQPPAISIRQDINKLELPVNSNFQAQVNSEELFPNKKITDYPPQNQNESRDQYVDRLRQWWINKEKQNKVMKELYSEMPKQEKIHSELQSENNLQLPAITKKDEDLRIEKPIHSDPTKKTNVSQPTPRIGTKNILKIEQKNTFYPLMVITKGPIEKYRDFIRKKKDAIRAGIIGLAALIGTLGTIQSFGQSNQDSLNTENAISTSKDITQSSKPSIDQDTKKETLANQPIVPQTDINNQLGETETNIVNEPETNISIDEGTPQVPITKPNPEIFGCPVTIKSGTKIANDQYASTNVNESEEKTVSYDEDRIGYINSIFFLNSITGNYDTIDCSKHNYNEVLTQYLSSHQGVVLSGFGISSKEIEQLTSIDKFNQSTIGFIAASILLQQNPELANRIDQLSKNDNYWFEISQETQLGGKSR